MGTPTSNPDWFMFHGDYAHSGYVSDSDIDSSQFPSNFDLLHSIQVDGSILSVPAVVGDDIFVGMANSHEATGSIGGALYKISLSSGDIVHQYIWDIDVNERDAHGFTGMGCTPTVLDGFVYFVGFNAKLYCLSADDLSCQWIVDLRHADTAFNQPITNIAGTEEAGVSPEDAAPVAAGWSSPLVANVSINGVLTPRIFLGIGEGENPDLYSFIYCIDPSNGHVVWIYCTCQFEEGRVNNVNELPAEVLRGTVPTEFTVYNGDPYVMGCSVWSAIAFDEGTGYIYACTGQPAMKGDPNFDRGLPSKGWSSGILALDAATGNFEAFTQMPADTAYRPTDLDVDIGAACTLYDQKRSWFWAIFFGKNRRVVSVGCKNGGFMVCDAKTLEILNTTQLLPKMNNGDQIPEIDPHPPTSEQNDIFPQVSNDVSNANYGENYFGPFNTAAIHPPTGRLFVGIGGPNYHNQAPGIDSNSTPFMRAIDYKTLKDVWPMDQNDPPRYKNVGESMYLTTGESGLSSPTVVNDVVFVTTSKVAIYAYKVSDGTLLWSDVLGAQTGGFNGGYGYCLGPAVVGNYVVAGALINGIKGGLLNIYGLKTP